MTRFVFDTNVIVSVSAIFFNDSVPKRAFIRTLNHGLFPGRWWKSCAVCLAGTVSTGMSPAKSATSFLNPLMRESDLIEITESVRACRDPEDDPVLELAVNGNATYFVTGDTDLLLLNPFRGVEIVTPAEFLKSPA